MLSSLLRLLLRTWCQAVPFKAFVLKGLWAGLARALWGTIRSGEEGIVMLVTASWGGGGVWEEFSNLP